MAAANKSIVGDMNFRARESALECSVQTDETVYNGAQGVMITPEHAEGATQSGRLTSKTRAIGELDLGFIGDPDQPPNFNHNTDKGQKGVSTGKIKASASPVGIVRRASVISASGIGDNTKYVWYTNDKDLSLVPPASRPGVPDGYVQKWVVGTTCIVYLFSAWEKWQLMMNGGVDTEYLIASDFSLIIPSAADLITGIEAHSHFEFLDLVAIITGAVTGGPLTLSLENGTTDFSAGGLVIPVSAALHDKHKLSDTSTIIAAQAQIHQGETFNLIAKTVTAISAGKCRLYAKIRHRLGT